MSEKTHEEALEIAIEFGAGTARDLEHMMREYLKARDWAMVPKFPTDGMMLAAEEKVVGLLSFKPVPTCPSYVAYVSFIDAAPDPFAPSP